MPAATRFETERGFSLLELTIVVAVSLVTLAMTAPMISNSITQYRLRTSAVDVNSLLQRARIQAIRDDKTYTVLGCPSSGTCSTAIGSTTQSLLVDLNGDRQYTGGEPMIRMQQGVTLTTAPSTLVSAATLGFSPQAQGSIIGFTSRGTPCFGNPCATWNGAAQVGFVLYMTATVGSGNGLIAISVSPSGRFHSWSYDPHGGWTQ